MKRYNKKLFQILITLCLVFSLALCSNSYQMVTKAYEAKAATVNGIDVKVRPAPGTNNTPLGSLNTGASVTVIDEAGYVSGYNWYKVTCVLNGVQTTGFMAADFVTINDISSDEATSKIVVFTGQQNIRTDADTKYASIAVANEGEKAIVLDQKMGAERIWYKVQYVTRDGRTIEGWTSSYCAQLQDAPSGPVESGPAIGATSAEEYVQAGFPQSYASKLAELSAKYPAWKFVPVKTGLDWNTVIQNESVTGKNLVQSSQNDACKSLANDAYDWKTNTWYGYDGAGWVAANPSYVAFRMDPRNYLDETFVFMFESLSYDSNQSLAGVQSIVKGTFLDKTITDTDGQSLNYAQTFYDVGKELGVSPYHLASRVYQEQNPGTSPLFMGNYPGYENYFNFFNISAVTTSAGTAIINGLKKAKAEGWNSRTKSIRGGADVIASSYIRVGQDTLYFEKFNVVNKKAGLYSHQYMTNVSAARSESIKVAAGYTDKNQAFVFKIPIYNNMPENPVAFSETGNPNNYLKSLSVSGVNMTPSFDGAKTNYSAVVNNSVTSVKVSASAVVGTSSVSGLGTYNLDVGNNSINVVCKAQNGETRTYTVTIVRKQNEQIDTSKDASISSGTYQIGEYITGIQPGTAVQTVLNNIVASNCAINIVDKNGAVNNGTVTTGNRICLYQNDVTVKEIPIIIYGDVSGDGKITLLDLIDEKRHLSKIEELEGLYMIAGDIDRNGKINLYDYIDIKRALMNLEEIKQ